MESIFQICQKLIVFKKKDDHQNYPPMISIWQQEVQTEKIMSALSSTRKIDHRSRLFPSVIYLQQPKTSTPKV